MKLNSQKGKKIGIFGLGLTGCSAFNALSGIAATILCWDDREENLQQFSSRFDAKHLVNIDDNAWAELDKIIISPGVPPAHSIFSLAKAYNILISSDIGMFLEEIVASKGQGNVQKKEPAKIIIVTGTNGKSTTTALIGHIMAHNGEDYHIGGNIGKPVLDLPLGARGYILELSSFQIDLLENFNTYLSVLLNITPDHLDRYGALEAYSKSKYKGSLAGDIKIIGIDSDLSKEFYDSLKKQGHKNLIPISACSKNEKNIKQTITCIDNKIIDNFFNKEMYDLLTDTILKGKHNLENIAASFAAARALGVMPADIIKHIASFKGLPHRMQYLGTKGNISFYNDSKATNAASASYSLSSLDNVFWLAGGIFKEESLVPIEYAFKSVKKAYLFGQDKLLFAQGLKNKVEYEICDTMAQAFALAFKDACATKEHSNILLAPACASYDQFKNFEDRGNKFIELYETK